jgi:ABC-type uncharacterized transport system permease subunit
METVFHASLVILCILYTVLVMAYARIFALGFDGIGRFARPLLIGTVALHFASVGLRGVMVGACPLGSQGEFLALVAFSIAVIYALLEMRIGERTTGVFAIAPAFALQLIATVRILGQEAPDDVKMGMYRSLHSFAAIVAFSAVAICGVYGVLYLFLYAAIKRGRFGLFYRNMPSLERLTDMNFVAAWMAFLALSVTVVMGFGVEHRVTAEPTTMWRADVILTVGLWILYGGAIVARRFFGLGGKRLAYTTVICSLLLVALFLRGLAGTAFHG